MEKHFMIDIETTGTNKATDDILEVGCLELHFDSKCGFWMLGNEFQMVLHSERQPETVFAKEHMTALYALCNKTDPSHNLNELSYNLKEFIHHGQVWNEPKFFMGWNASNFDLEFLFKKDVLTPSYYEKISDNKEVLRGDAHYRVYEQTGAIQLLSDATGLSRKAVLAIAEDLNPTKIELPKGKQHDALYDCYRQVIMMNGLIALARDGATKFKRMR